MEKSKKLLITGGAGFIGSHLADLLIGKNEVHVLDNLHLGKEENISHLYQNNRFRFFKQDLMDFEATKKLFSEQKYDRVYHLAANSDISGSLKNRDLDFDLNLQTTRSVLEAMVESGCKEIVFASTSAIYGELKGNISENAGPLFPVSFYGASKLSAEAFISVYVHTYALKAWIVRFPNVVGERTTHGVIHDFILKLRKNPKELEILGDGEQNKPYLYVKDLCSAIEFFISKSDEGINYVNISGEGRTKVKNIAEIVAREMKLNPKFKFTGGRVGWVGDVPEFSYDVSKFHSLGWKTRVDSNQAVEMAVRNILKDPKGI